MQPHIYFEVTHAFPEKPILRNDVYAALGIDRWDASRWPGMVSLLKVEEDQARILSGFFPIQEAPPQPQWHPLASGYPPDWASGWGQDECGVFVEFAVGEVTQRMRWCPPGQFLMGSPITEDERHDGEGPQVEVTFAEGFWLFDTPVANALFDAVMDHMTSATTDTDCPVTEVIWDEAQEFLQRLNALIPGLELRLPSEAEWEYACRAGSRTPFEPTVARQFSGQTITPEEVNYDGNYPYDDAPNDVYWGKTVAVKPHRFRPNKWGLWQMHGNVYEWCADIWSDNHEGAAPDGSARQASRRDGESYRVLRGGSWCNDARFCRSAYRAGYAPDNRFGDVGFRPARGQQGAQASAAEPPSGVAESEA